MLRAYISVILKKGKDASQCGSYRPISLLNFNLKIFTKIIANRLAPHLQELIHYDKVGFMQGREARDSTTIAIDVIPKIKKDKVDGCLLMPKRHLKGSIGVSCSKP